MTALAQPSFGAVLRQVWPRHTAKNAAAAAGLSIRTAQAWVSSRCSPSADTLLRMARENDALRAEVVRLLIGKESHEGMDEVVGAAAGTPAAAEGASADAAGGCVAPLGRKAVGPC